MWRYLPPAVVMVCSALVLIAGATGDLQSWSQSVDEFPSWRTMMDAASWTPAVKVWDSGMAMLRRNASLPRGAAPPPAGAQVPAAAAAPIAPATTPAPSRPSVVTQPSPAPAATALLPPQRQAAVSPLQRRLMDARQALTAGHAADAEKMLETARAELGFRPTREGNAMQVDMPATWIGRALSSLKSGDSGGALHELDLAIASS
jgi:hypothetical protein